MPEFLIERRGAPVLLFTLLAVAFASLLIGTTSARAASPVTGFFAGPVSAAGACNPEASVTATAAASRTDFCVAYRTQTAAPSADDLASQVIDTPRGFSGEPDRFPQCTDAQFNTDSESNAACPANSQMGSVAAQIRAQTSIKTGFTVGEIGPTGIATLAPTGAVYNLEHSENEVARLGIDLRPTALGGSIDEPNVKIIVRVTLRPSPDVGLRSIIENLPKTAHVVVPLLGVNETDQLAIDSFSLRFWGSQTDHPSMPMDYGMLGSDCSTDQNTHFAAVSYDGTPTSADAAAYRLTGCDAAPFTPSAEYTTTENRPDVTTETNVKVKFAESAGPLTAAAVKQTIVTLPAGLSFSGQIASGPNGLPLCTADQFAHFSAAASTCPDATAVGTVAFKSPLLSRTLTGRAFLGPQPAAGALPDLYIEAEQGPAADAPRIKLVGHLTIDSQNRIVTTIDDLPQVLVDTFDLTFRGGDQAAIVTPPTCGDSKGALSATSYASATPVTSEQTYSVNTECDAVTGFAPTVGFALANPVAGGTGAFTTTISRPDRSQRIGATSVNLPAGMLANLKGVPECAPAAAVANQCPADTKVGTVNSLAGVGPAPYSAAGSVYLTSRAAGDVAGLSLSVPVKFGEVDLGTLVVPAGIKIRQDDLGLQFNAAVPERFAGVPLNIRSIGVTLDRPNFPLNPTNCGVLNTTSAITAVGGAVAAAPASMQVSGCDKLKFAPEIQAAVTGATGNLGRPSVAVRITSADGSSALRQTYVTLPKGIGVDLAQIPRACALADFQAGGCADVAKIGKVSGSLAIADDALAGDLYLLKVPGKTLPGLGLAFTGRFSGRVVGTSAINTKTGQLVTQFEALPDLPLTAFQIDVTGGTGGAVIATTALCSGSRIAFNATFIAHSGPRVDRTTTNYCGVPLGVLGPKVSAKLGSVRKGTPTVVMTLTAPTGQKIKQVDVQLPKGYTLSSSRSKSSRYVVLKKLTAKGKTSSKRVSTSKLRVRLPTAGSTKLQLITRTGTIAIKSSSVRKSKAKVIVPITVVYASGQKITVPVRLTPH